MSWSEAAIGDGFIVWESRRLVGVDPKTVRRYTRAAEANGLQREDGPAALTEERAELISAQEALNLALAQARSEVDDAAEATASTELFLWTTFTRFEPAADLTGREKREARFHVELVPPVVINARMKPWYPEVMAVDEPTKALVDRRWAEYGIPD